MKCDGQRGAVRASSRARTSLGGRFRAGEQPTNQRSSPSGVTCWTFIPTTSSGRVRSPGRTARTTPTGSGSVRASPMPDGDTSEIIAGRQRRSGGATRRQAQPVAKWMRRSERRSNLGPGGSVMACPVDVSGTSGTTGLAFAWGGVKRPLNYAGDDFLRGRRLRISERSTPNPSSSGR